MAKARPTRHGARETDASALQQLLPQFDEILAMLRAIDTLHAAALPAIQEFTTLALNLLAAATSDDPRRRARQQRQQVLGQLESLQRSIAALRKNIAAATPRASSLAPAIRISPDVFARVRS